MKTILIYKNFNFFCVRCLFNYQKRKFSNFSSKSSNSELYSDLINQVDKYRQELKNHLKSSLRHRYLINSIENLNKGFFFF